MVPPRIGGLGGQEVQFLNELLERKRSSQSTNRDCVATCRIARTKHKHYSWSNNDVFGNRIAIEQLKMGCGRRLRTSDTTRATEQTREVDISTQVTASDARWLPDIKPKQITFFEQVEQIGIGHPVKSIHVARESSILNIGIGEAKPSTKIKLIACQLSDPPKALVLNFEATLVGKVMPTKLSPTALPSVPLLV